MKAKKEVIIGALSILAIASLVVGFFFLKGLNIFKNQRTFHVKYVNVQGLMESNAITVNGFQIGQVTKISFQPQEPDSVLVEFVINYKDIQIPMDTRAELRSDILGTRSIELLLGNSTMFAKKGDFIVGLTQKDLQDQVNEQLLPLKNKTENLIGSLDTVINTISEIFDLNKGSLNTSINSLQVAIKHFESTSRSVDSILLENRFVFKSVMSRVESITTNLQKSNQQITNTVQNLSDISDSLAAADLVGTVENAKKALHETNLILTAINNKEGSLGQLVYNDSLINNVNIMVDQAQRLIENIKDHPNRYLQFSVFGSKEKGLKLDSRDEKALKEFLKKYRPEPIKE
ncbi:MAG: MlaD family protein [Bacteroidia bacterium]